VTDRRRIDTRRAADQAALAATRARGLAAVGAHLGEDVRWQDRTGGRWQEGSVSHREADGSVAVVDGEGRARSLLAERLQVRSRGTRGGRRWEPLPVRAARGEQLCLFA
jgi:hypothetical protein